MYATWRIMAFTPQGEVFAEIVCILLLYPLLPNTKRKKQKQNLTLLPLLLLYFYFFNRSFHPTTSPVQPGAGPISKLYILHRLRIEGLPSLLKRETWEDMCIVLRRGLREEGRRGNLRDSKRNGKWENEREGRQFGELFSSQKESGVDSLTGRELKKGKLV